MIINVMDRHGRIAANKLKLSMVKVTWDFDKDDKLWMLNKW